MNAMVVAMESMAGTGVSFQGLTDDQLRASALETTVSGNVSVTGTVAVTGVSTSAKQDLANTLLNEIAANTLVSSLNRESNPNANDGYSSMRYIYSLATTNATLVKNTAGSIGAIHLYSTLTTTTVAYLKLYNKATLPIPGTDVPFAVYKIGGSNSLSIEFPKGMKFSQGLGFAITRGGSPIDILIIGIGEITGQIVYI